MNIVRNVVGTLIYLAFRAPGVLGLGVLWVTAAILVAIGLWTVMRWIIGF